MATGYPLTPVEANVYMDHFEQTAISTAIHKPIRWYIQVRGQHLCCMAAWKTGVTRISETSKWYPRKHQVYYEDR